MDEGSSSSFFEAPEASKTQEIESSSGEKLFTRAWEVPSPKGLVFICHGFSEHTRYYNEVCQALNAKGLYCFGHDHIGHGRSSGKRTLIDSADEYLEDVLLHVRQVRKTFPSLPLFVVAHSMGGLIALRGALLHPDIFKGVVLVGPLIIAGGSLGKIDMGKVTSRRAPFVRGFLKVLDTLNKEMIIGTMKLPQVSRDKALQEHMAQDELKWDRGMKVRTVMALVDCMEDNYGMLGSMKVPFLSIHGDKDEICNVKGSRSLLKKAFVEDKTILEIPGAVHNLFMEDFSTRNQTITATVDWIAQRCC